MIDVLSNSMGLVVRIMNAMVVEYYWISSSRVVEIPVITVIAGIAAVFNAVLVLVVE